MKKVFLRYMIVTSLVCSLLSPVYASVVEDTATIEITDPEYTKKYEQKAIEYLNKLESQSVPNIEKAASKNRINIILNGVDVTSTVSSDLNPIISSGVTYVPVRLLENILEEVKIDYNATTKMIKINGKNNWIMLQIGKGTGYNCMYAPEYIRLYNYEFSNDKPAMAFGRVYLPLRYAVEKLGYKVLWDGSTSTLSISTTEAAPTIPDTIKAKPKTGSYYLGGKAFTLPKGITLTTDEHGYAYTPGDLFSIQVQARCSKEPTESDYVSSGYAYSGSLTIISDEKGGFAPLATQYKLTEEILNQIFTKDQVKEIMSIVRKDFAVQDESERHYVTYGDIKLEIASSRKMVAHEDIIFHQLVK
ncbi:stalk domain-containing protein [Cellulosilyticum sp. WCF-2]|uniref:stalk domain-containing protein n=1 Tax=Cellulosilyticum sp. WCF-2 TaxID=2497860 RepID=UPI000F8D512B|nr:stalk domain-containing protein [Cellulosilyticum sp. WCF-2]QEH67705.1 hypothetical protein EKH84_04560 [Cellulosilyticum sp. WCF-2]